MKIEFTEEQVTMLGAAVIAICQYGDMDRNRRQKYIKLAEKLLTAQSMVDSAKTKV